MENFSWLREQLLKAYGSELTEKIWRGYETARPVTLRVNSLKTDIARVKESLSACGIEFSCVDWYEDALIVNNVRENQIAKTALYQNGEIYLQSLSSMLPPLYMDAQENETILDMTAAPGGKTTQLSALSNGRAFITACERDAVRSERLRFNIEKQGAPRVSVLTVDSSKLDDFFQFDKILLDAPCSGSGTVQVNEPLKISEKLVKNSVALQKKLISKAVKLLKRGGTLVYSTCSVFHCENEEILDWALKDRNVELVPLTSFPNIPRLPSKEGTVCVCPNELFEGFFVGKLKKL